jgi:hypothetical protein
MKKMFIIFSIVLLTILLAGCKSIDYNEVYLNDEIQFTSVYSQQEMHEIIKEAMTSYTKTQRVEIYSSYKNDKTSQKSITKYDIGKQKLIFESTLEAFNDILEKKIYVYDSYMYEYNNNNGDITKQKFKLFLNDVPFERIVVPYIPYMSYEFIFQDHIQSYGSYKCGIDQYNNTVLIFEPDKELPAMALYCKVLVIKDGLPLFYVYYHYGLEYVCEFKYKSISLKMPKLEGYEQVNE